MGQNAVMRRERALGHAPSASAVPGGSTVAANGAGDDSAPANNADQDGGAAEAEGGDSSPSTDVCDDGDTSTDDAADVDDAGAAASGGGANAGDAAVPNANDSAAA